MCNATLGILVGSDPVSRELRWVGLVDFYKELGVRRVLNAAASFTLVGGSLMPEEVVDAMRSASRSYIDMHELHIAAGRRLAELTRNEAAYATSGCAAALVLATLGAITKGDPRNIVRMPEGKGLATDVVMHTVHRCPYDPAVQLAGGKIVQFGNAYQTFDWELEAAITDQTALVLWVDGTDLGHGALDVATTVKIAHARGVPVLVDAAAQIPPHTNLWHYTRDLGADAAVFSGGKHLRGPQSSGLMVGTSEFIDAARANGAPYQRLARALKAGKEDIAGLVRAVELFLAQDHDAVAREWEQTVQDWIDALSRVPGLTAVRDFPNEAGQPIPRVMVTADRDVTGISGDEMLARLWERDPRVCVLHANADSFYLTPETLSPGEAPLVIAAIGEVATAAG
jgi:D-glucosaminate-6-phosphate ammonia-lyase